MTLQQLKFISAIAQYGSISLAARRLFVSQPRMTSALQELEQELQKTLFVRSSRGTELTEEGLKFLGRAKEIMRQIEELEGQYAQENTRQYFSVSTQHYTFTAKAFVDLVRAYGKDDYEFFLLEERTGKIIENVANLKSEIGVIYLSHFNEVALRKLLKAHDLCFTPFFTVRPHVFISRHHPLAALAVIHLPDLEKYPCLTFDQGEKFSFYFTEEVCSDRALRKRICVTDRAAVVDFLRDLDAYIITTGVLPSYFHGQDITSRPLDVDEEITVGVIRRIDAITSELGQTFLGALKKVAQDIEKGQEADASDAAP